MLLLQVCGDLARLINVVVTGVCRSSQMNPFCCYRCVCSQVNLCCCYGCV